MQTNGHECVLIMYGGFVELQKMPAIYRFAPSPMLIFDDVFTFFLAHFVLTMVPAGRTSMRREAAASLHETRHLSFHQQKSRFPDILTRR